MITDSELKIRGYEVLFEALGKIEAEKFIALISREPFDYTEWQKNLLKDKTIQEISNSAMENRKQAEK